MAKKNKKILIFTLFTSLFSCLVGGVSTFAWFQLDQKPIKSELVSGSPNLSILNNSTSKIYGYKINQGIGDTGFVDHISDDVAQFGSHGIEGTNHHQDKSDTNFNVPSNGIGYYLVRKNPGGNFKYKYTNDGVNYSSYSWKFNEMSSTLTLSSGTTNRQTYRAYVSSISVTDDDITNGLNVFRVMHYTFKNSKTVNEQLKIYTNTSTSTSYVMGAGASVDPITFDVTVTDPGYYKVWLDYNQIISAETYGYLSFEKRIDSANFPSRSNKNKSILKNRSYTSTGSKTVTEVYVEDQVNSNAKVISIENIGFDETNGYGHTQFRAFLTSLYGERKSYTTSAGTAMPSTPGWSYSDTEYKYLICPTGNKNFTFRFPEWVFYAGYKICANNYHNWFGELSNNDNSIYFRKYESYSGANDVWGYGKKISHYIYNSGGWKMNANQGSSSTYNWGSSSISKYARFNNSSNLKSFTADTVSKYYLYDSPQNVNELIENYTSTTVWYTNAAMTTSLSSNPIFATSNTYSIYLKYNANLTLKGSIFIKTSANGEWEQFSTIDLETINVSYNTQCTIPAYGSRDIADDNNGLYASSSNVSRDYINYWYSSESCSTTVTTNGKYTVTQPKTLYARFNIDISSYKTFYVDIASCYEKTYNGRWSSVEARANSDSRTKYVNAIQVANNLYRLTLPCGNSGWDFKLGDGSNNTYGHDRTQTFNTGGCSNSGSSILYLFECNNGSNHTWGWQDAISSNSYGTATIKISSDGTNWIDPITKTTSFTTEMDIGDGTNNYFIYEHGLQIPSGYYIDVVVADSPGTPTIGHYGLVSNNKYYNPSDRKYIDTTGTYLRTTSYSGNSRFNLYIDNNGKLSITMVPDYGNGFYIIPYSVDLGTNTFSNSIKMTSNSDKKATYEGFYATKDSYFFIRSYLNANDKLYTSLTASDETIKFGKNENDDNVDGLIKFESANYYTIVVENETIKISSYSVDASFKLNKLDTSSVTYAKNIWEQKTSLVIEVPFTCNNTYGSVLSLNVQNALSAFVGVSLYVSKERITSSSSYETDPYHFMRGTNANTRSTYYNNLSNSDTITDLADESISSSDGTCYAYILIDYLPSSTNAANTPSGNSAYNGSTCTNGIYNSSTFISTDLSANVAFYLVAEQE